MGHTNDTAVSDQCITDLEAQKEYLGSVRVMLYFNDQKLVTDNFGADSIKNTSKIIYTNVSTDTPSYFSFDLQTTFLEDQTDLFQLGNSVKTYFISPTQKQKTDFKIQKSGWRDFPQKYKFFSTHIAIGPDVLKIRRKTESLLDLLSAVGGLFRAFNIIGEAIINPYTLYALKAHLALNLVRYIPSKISKHDKRKTV